MAVDLVEMMEGSKDYWVVMAEGRFVGRTGLEGLVGVERKQWRGR